MRILLIAILFLYSLTSFSQPANIDSNYLKVFTTIEGMLSQREPSSFKYAVFLTENVALENSLIYSKFNEHIVKLATLVKYWMEFNPLKDYHNSDSINVQKNYALFTFFKDTLKISLTKEGDFMHLPYTYDFLDFFGQKDLGNMFVTKLLSVHKGNCHSLPYLYKILAVRGNLLAILCPQPHVHQKPLPKNRLVQHRINKWRVSYRCVDCHKWLCSN